MTTSTKKRPKSDSAAGAVLAAMNAAKGLHKPPAFMTLTTDAMLYWPAVMGARARDDWTDVDLVVAAQLVQCQADMAEEDKLLRQETRVLRNERGTKVMNPRVTVLEQLARREMALMRTLRMGGRAHGTDPRDDAKRAKYDAKARAVRQQVESEDEEDLLAHA